MTAKQDDSAFKLAADFPPASREDWLSAVEATLKGGDFDKVLVSRSHDGVRIDPIYPPVADAPAVPGHRTGAWQVCQLFANPDPGIVNKAIARDLAAGADAVVLQIAAPGQSGIEINSGTDLATALKGIDLSKTPVRLRAGARFEEVSGWLLELTNNAHALQGGLDADPIGTLAATGALPVSLDDALSAAARLAKIAARDTPNLTTLLADGRPYHEAGASEAQELAAMLATGTAYLRALEGAGLDLDAAFGQIALRLSCDADQFTTIAKFRAARNLWVRVAGACNIEAGDLKVTLIGETSARMMTRHDPWVNMLRGTVACFGAALGGADAITVRPFTTALGLPDRFARRIARNTQSILKSESSLARVSDPARGAGYFEHLSTEIAKSAWALFQEIESAGGIAKALRTGLIAEKIDQTATARAADIARRKLAITGISEFPNLNEKIPQTAPRPDAPPIAGKTEIDPLAPVQLSEPFEDLRDRASDHARGGAAPKVFLAGLGKLADYSARSGFARNLFAAGGIAAVEAGDFANADDAATAFKKSKARIACVCGTDDAYSQGAEDIARALKQAGARQIYLAGRPGERQSAFEAAGIGGFVHIGCNVIDVLEDAHDHAGLKP